MYENLLDNIDALYKMYQEGSLGGEVMPEDENPRLEKSSLENYLYFTLPMSLNYQRNSYTLWECANKTYNDKETNFVFNPHEVLKRPVEEVQFALTKYRVALQKNKQTEIWIKICQTFVDLYDGDIRKMFIELDSDVNKIRDFIQIKNKKLFPYLSGNKLCNYWLYVIWQYTTQEYKNIECLTVAADTHVIKATHRLGLITAEELEKSDVQLIVINRWNEILKGTKYKPIDIHTPLWLWSRNGFKQLHLNNSLEEIIDSCKYVTTNSKHVNINDDIIVNLIDKFNMEKPKHWLSSNPYNLLELNTSEIVNFLIIYGTMNCSYWGDTKWTIETKNGPEDGAFALISALLSLRSEAGSLDFEKISIDQFKRHLAGNIEIPLLKERYKNALEVSKIINAKMHGDFYAYTKNITTDIKLFNIIINNFKCFHDTRTYNQKEIPFYKLAQLVTSDILHIRELKEHIHVDYSHLVGCADYKIPQALRALGVLEYDEELSNIVDSKIELEENSIYEVEIRANMITAINKIKEKLPNLPAIDINDMIWELSHDKSLNLKPYHRTRTMSY